MNCTPEKCPHGELMEKARAACLACKTKPSAYAHIVSFETMGERVLEDEMLNRDFSDRYPDGCTETLDLHDEDALRKLLASLAVLTRNEVVLLWHLLNKRTPIQIANLEGQSRATIHARIKSAIDRIPWLDALYSDNKRKYIMTAARRDVLKCAQQARSRSKATSGHDKAL